MDTISKISVCLLTSVETYQPLSILLKSKPYSKWTNDHFLMNRLKRKVNKSTDAAFFKTYF